MPESERKQRKSTKQLSIVYPLAAGIDVGATAHVVAVPVERDGRPVRTFRTFSADLHRLADWLAEVGITTTAMEWRVLDTGFLKSWRHTASRCCW